MRRMPWRGRGPLVSEVSHGRVHIERGRPSTIVDSDRVALVAQFSVGPLQPKSLSEYLKRLDAAGYATVVISTCESAEPLEFPAGIPQDTMIIRRPNLGYDFGSWTTALGCFPELRDAGTVLLTNDSLLGPFAEIDHLLEWAAAPGPDIRGLTASFQFAHHIQSFFLSFRGGILADQPWRDFFNAVRVEPGKDDVVMSYEIGVSRLAFAECYSSEVWVTGPELGVPYGNPTVDGWKNLIESGVPFLKRTIMTHPSTEAEAAEAAQYIRRRFGTDVNEW
ncbi:Rhamnan synthesis protein F [Actinomyces ruminicola]|uniref:Rhamnan synthesis protein F n=1 Tax=Actinomyces ruminicola TaxID=332524 RepID=A0A1G9ZRH1_9ACTO|nr:Rhamnan synthesis protein F [Actinomyces ruminicola]